MPNYYYLIAAWNETIRGPIVAKTKTAARRALKELILIPPESGRKTRYLWVEDPALSEIHANEKDTPVIPNNYPTIYCSAKRASFHVDYMTGRCVSDGSGATRPITSNIKAVDLLAYRRATNLDFTFRTVELKHLPLILTNGKYLVPVQ